MVMGEEAELLEQMVETVEAANVPSGRPRASRRVRRESLHKRHGQQAAFKATMERRRKLRKIAAASRARNRSAR